jgi:hypothetical protein
MRNWEPALQFLPRVAPATEKRISSGCFHKKIAGGEPAIFLKMLFDPVCGLAAGNRSARI